MIRLRVEKTTLRTSLIFTSQDVPGMVEVESKHDWRQSTQLQAIATLLTGADHGKLRESIEVVDQEGKRLHYLEKL